MEIFYLYLLLLEVDPPFDAFLLASASEAAASDASETSDGALCIDFFVLLLTGVLVVVFKGVLVLLLRA